VILAVSWSACCLAVDEGQVAGDSVLAQCCESGCFHSDKIPRNGHKKIGKIGPNRIVVFYLLAETDCSFRSVLCFNQKYTMDNVQQVCHFNNTPSSQTLRKSLFILNLIYFSL
jgi:hypothetical protein